MTDLINDEPNVAILCAGIDGKVGPFLGAVLDRVSYKIRHVL